MMKSQSIATLLILSLLATVKCSTDEPQPRTFTDSRDGTTYKIARIGRQTWMSENLRYKVGTSKCYDFDDVNCYLYGALYKHEDALAACPNGWHLPSKEEYETLVEFVGGEKAAGTLLAPGGKLDGKEIGFNVLAAGTYTSFFLTWASTEGIGQRPMAASLIPLRTSAFRLR